MKKSMKVYWSCMAVILCAETYEGAYYWMHQTRSADLVGGYAGFMSIALNLINFMLLAIAMVCQAIAAFKHRGSRGQYFVIGLCSLAAIALSSHLVDLILTANAR